MKYKLMVVYERPDGSIFKQHIKTLTEEESVDNALIHRIIKAYTERLGEAYYLIDYYFMY